MLFPGREVINRHLLWTDGVMKFIGVSPEPRRIVGVVPDIDDERIVPGPALTVYHPFEQEVSGGRVFVHTRNDPYSLVPNITRIVRELASDQPVEQAHAVMVVGQRGQRGRLSGRAQRGAEDEGAGHRNDWQSHGIS